MLAMIDEMNQVRRAGMLFHRATVLFILKKFMVEVEQDETALLQAAMQLIYGKKNTMLKWWLYLYSRMAGFREKKTEVGLTRTMIQSLFTIVGELINHTGFPLPVVKHFNSSVLGITASADSVQASNIFDQMEILKEKLRNLFSDPETDELKLDDSKRKELLELMLKNAKELGFVVSDNCKLKMAQAIELLAPESTETKNSRPEMFFLLNLLLEDDKRFALTPLAGCKKAHVGFSVLDLHGYLYTHCSAYKRLCAKFKIGKKLTDNSRLLLFDKIWIDYSVLNSATRKAFENETFVLDSVIRTNGKRLVVSYVNKKRIRTGNYSLLIIY